ncbi:flavin reductase family protein [Nocardia sp. NPDC101769]|uniref:flavin reductase family protein n=1 Tax=Nocardia sp. NPDC101769 TaxID=3364333 RepID=UPI003826E365
MLSAQPTSLGVQIREPVVSWCEPLEEYPAASAGAAELRAAMRTFATGVAVATTYRDGPGGRDHDAVTVNSLCSLSLRPPLVSIALRSDSSFGAALAESGVWAVSILDGRSHRIAQLFARDHHRRAAALAEVSSRPGRRIGALVFDAAGWLECRLAHRFPVGDHTLFVGEVLAAGARATGSRLAFLHGAFHVLDVPDPEGDLR